jgi:hypothetical protein
MTILPETGLSRRGASMLWIMLLTAASTITTLLLACATPFPALAALAAVHMHRRDGLTLMGAAWAASQLTGFLILGYEIKDTTWGWAAGLGVAALVSAAGSYAALGRLSGRSTALRLAVAYVAGFVAFKLVILFFSFGLGGVATTLDPDILTRQFLRNGAILTGLFLLYRGLVAAGVPAAAPRTAVA